jgi:hypothetical protein
MKEFLVFGEYNVALFPFVLYLHRYENIKALPIMENTIFKTL